MSPQMLATALAKTTSGPLEKKRKGLKRNAPQALSKYGGVDETRTRDLRRDRPAF
jgi:hypothetical protein